MVSAVVAECHRVAALEGVVPPGDIHRLTLLTSAFRSIPSVCEAFCHAVGQICQGPSSVPVVANREECGEPVLIELIAAMKQHPSVVDVLSSACYATYTITWAQDALLASAIRMGIVPRIITAMARFPSDTVFQRAACIGLERIAQLPEGVAAIVSWQGARAVLAAQAAHPTNADIQQYSALVLASLAM